MSDTLLLAADGRGTRVAIVHVYPTTGPAREFERMTSLVTVTQRRGTVSIGFRDYFEGGDCMAPEFSYARLRVSGDRLHIGQAPHVATFQRVAP